MRVSKSKIVSIIITSIFAICLLLIGFSKNIYLKPNTYYQIYLDGEKIGVIDNDADLYNLINENLIIKGGFAWKKTYQTNQLHLRIRYLERLSFGCF